MREQKKKGTRVDSTESLYVSGVHDEDLIGRRGSSFRVYVARLVSVRVYTYVCRKPTF